MAKSAWDQYVRGPEVEALLRLGDENFDVTANGSAPKAAATVVEPEVEPQTDEAGDDGGNDKPPSAPPATAEPDAEAVEVDLAEIEPWEGFSTEKVSGIVEAIAAAERDYTEDELRDLLANIWAYEAAHKNRTGIMNALEGVAERMAAGDGASESAPDPEPDPEPQAEADPEPAPVPEPEPAPEEVTIPEPSEAVETEVPAEPEAEAPFEIPAAEGTTERKPRPERTPRNAEKAVTQDAGPPADPASTDPDYGSLMATVESELAARARARSQAADRGSSRSALGLDAPLQRSFRSSTASTRPSPTTRATCWLS
jgi:hypothetical protein